MEETSRSRKLFNSLLYKLTHGLSRLVTVFFLDYRIEGQNRMPDEGPVLILSNHESTLDPVLVGILFRRKLVYLAKKSLFKNPIFGGLIRSYDSIPIDRERGGLEGLRAILERLKLGRPFSFFQKVRDQEQAACFQSKVDSCRWQNEAKQHSCLLPSSEVTQF